MRMTEPQRRSAQFAVDHNGLVRELSNGTCTKATWHRMLRRMWLAGWMQRASNGDGYLITEQGRAALSRVRMPAARREAPDAS